MNNIPCIECFRGILELGEVGTKCKCTYCKQKFIVTAKNTVIYANDKEISKQNNKERTSNDEENSV